ncbi:MAG TPA: hypothetical protein ENI51_06845 [Candidatus Atribacteria bacterium]|nr:hypothetical protein [Candidatus Atribacteria bacterium]
MKKEIKQLKEYLISDKSEKADDYLVFPLFKKIFGKKFKRETAAEYADIYIEGKLVVELKTKYEDWLKGFFQAIHYKKKGLAFSAICIIAHNFIGLWKLKEIPTFAIEISEKSNPQKSASDIGRSNARKINKGQKTDIINSAAIFIHPFDEDSIFGRESLVSISEFIDALKNLDSERRQINPQNFIRKIEYMKSFFDDPMEAIHCFYTILNFWDTTARVPKPPPSEASKLFVVGNNAGRTSERFYVNPRKQDDLRKFVEEHYVFTNEGSGLTVDYYFSRFDEVISKIKPEYTRQHGIIFTDHNLSKFALWFVHYYYEKKLSENYIVLDPAGGSGNLITSWRNHLKHKIVSELEPDLLKIIERRMKADPEHLEIGFTIVPKTTTGKGLNFLDKPADEYIEHIKRELKEKNLKLDKPIAFLLNPPYKNTDENIKYLKKTCADYEIDNSILKLTGKDIGRERYLAFLGQILNITKLQVEENPGFSPIIMIFTPTSWLIPRITYEPFRREFDKYFKYEKGFIITSKEFFKIGGRWPVAFTIWRYNYKENGNKNIIKVRDYTFLKSDELEINWNDKLEVINKNIKSLIRGSKMVTLKNRGDIREMLPEIKNIKTGKSIKQPRYDFSYPKKNKDMGKLVSGFPISDNRRHFELQRKCGEPRGDYVGFMDDNTPVRVSQDNFNRMSNRCDRVWFILFNTFANVNKSKIFSGPPDNRGFCAYDLESAKTTFLWFALSKAVNGRYPIWANQYDIWMPYIKKELEKYFYSLCFAYGLSENRCVVTKFEADNPVEGAVEIFVDNPLCPANPDSFWSKLLEREIIKKPELAMSLVNSIKKLYKVWNGEYCKGGIIENVGLDKEPYFKYFNYPDFLTPYSGLVQIRKYAEIRHSDDLDDCFNDIKEKTKIVLDEIYRILIEEFNYFD